MRVFITVILSLAIVRFLSRYVQKYDNSDFDFSDLISMLLCITMEVLGIIFVWKI